MEEAIRIAVGAVFTSLSAYALVRWRLQLIEIGHRHWERLGFPRSRLELHVLSIVGPVFAALVALILWIGFLDALLTALRSAP